MALPAHVETLDTVPEELRPHYVPAEDGGFRLDAEGIEDVSGLKSALAKERAARKALRAELDARAGPEGENGDGDGDSDGGAAGDGDMPAAGDPGPVERLRRQLERRLVEAEARAAIVAARGAPELLLPVLLPLLGVEEGEDGAFRARVLSGVAGGEVPESLEALVEGLRRSDVYGRAFDGSGKSGSGAPAESAGPGGAAAVSAGDPRALGRHLADIAAGRVSVEA